MLKILHMSLKIPKSLKNLSASPRNSYINCNNLCLYIVHAPNFDDFCR